MRLRDVLEKAGVANRAVEVVLIGADGGGGRGQKTASPGPIAFARSISDGEGYGRRDSAGLCNERRALTAQHGFRCGR